MQHLFSEKKNKAKIFSQTEQETKKKTHTKDISDQTSQVAACVNKSYINF